MRRWRRWLVGLVVVAAIGAAAGGWRFLRTHPVVDVVRPERREVVELVIATGRLRAVRQSTLGSEVSGVADRVLVDDGDLVKAGQPLVALRQADAERRVEQARLAVETAARELARVKAGAPAEEIRRAQAERTRAEATLEHLEREHSRARQLFERGLVARAELDRAETSLEGARAAVQAAGEALLALRNQPRIDDLRVAEARLREAEAAFRSAEVEMTKRTIAAPFGGVVVKRAVEPGQSVAPGTPLLTLADMSRTELLVETDENNLGKLRPGQPATVVAPAYVAQPFKAVLRQIGPEVDSQRGVVGLRLDPVALPAYARPDMTVDVSIEVARIPGALAVPATAVTERGGRPVVLVLEGNRARSQDVRLRGRNPEWAAVEGLAPDARVVLRAAEVAPGQAVRPREAGR